jgi:YD repeat-containing protein
MTEREQAGLRGPIKLCRNATEYVCSEPSRTMYTDDTFSPQGQLLERRHCNPDGSHWVTSLRYGEHGRLIEKEEAGQTFAYRYDSLGRLEQVHQGDRVVESVKYAADGTKTQTCYNAKIQCTGVSANSMLHLSIDTVVTMTILDVNDRPTRKVLYDEDDRIIRRIAYRYNARGLLLEEGELINAAIRDDFRNRYRYDDLCRKIEVDQRWGGLGGERRTFDYNSEGDVGRVSIEQRTGLAWPEEKPQRWAQRFDYQYDDRGNWIERTTETILETGNIRLDNLDRRGLTYY